MKKVSLMFFLFALLFCSLWPATAQEQEPCQGGHTCDWVVYLDGDLVAIGDPIPGQNTSCAATTLEISKFTESKRDLGVEIWGGECSGGNIFVIQMGRVEIKLHLGLNLELTPQYIGWVGDWYLVLPELSLPR